MSSDYNDPRPKFEETPSSKTMRKVKENPMVPLGMAGFFTCVAFGIRRFRNRPKNMTASMFIMRYRVFAQSIAVGFMGLGIGYTALRDYYNTNQQLDKDVKGKGT